MLSQCLADLEEFVFGEKARGTFDSFITLGLGHGGRVSLIAAPSRSWANRFGSARKNRELGPQLEPLRR